MNLRILLAVVLLASALAVVPLGCTQSDDTIQQPTTLPPLVVDRDAPLLLDGPADTPKHITPADSKNATCFVCHANYQDEPIAQSHAKANLGCSNCHGESIAHKNDENHITPPDKMYPANEIDSACRKCHATHDVQPAAVVRKWQKQSSQKVYEKPIVCTDCHGDHRLKLRSVRWNKKTGKLLPPNK